MFDLPSELSLLDAWESASMGELKSVQGLFWIDSAPRADVSRLGVGSHGDLS